MSMNRARIVSIMSWFFECRQEVTGNPMKSGIRKIATYLPLIVLGSVAFLALILIQRSKGDDAFFFNLATSTHLFEALKIRYFSWSGRLLPEAVLLTVIKNLWVWRGLNAFMLVVLASTIFQYVKIHFPGKDFLKTAFISILFFTIPVKTLGYAAVWVTGSVNYLWTTSAMFVALYPFYALIFGHEVKKRFFLASIIAGMYAAFFEQTAAVMVVSCLLILIYAFLQKLKFDKWLIVEYILILLCALMLFLCPGHHIRVISETAKWYPGFSDLSILHKIFNAANILINHLMNISWAIELILLVTLSSLLVSVKASLPICMFSFALIGFFLVRPFESVHAIFFATGTVNSTFTEMTINIPAVLTGIAFMVSIPLFIFHIFTEERKLRVTLILLYLSALAATIIVGFSPTVFASEYRIFFVTDVLLLALASILFAKLIDTVPKDGQKFLLIVYGIIIAISGIDQFMTLANIPQQFLHI